MSWYDLFQLHLGTFDNKEAPQAEDSLPFWNSVFIEGSYVVDRQLGDTGINCFSLTKQLLMHHQVMDKAWWSTSSDMQN